jgi:hypothetical protein
MLLHIRPIAVSCAVLCFFAMGIVGSLGGLSPCTSCKRAVMGAALAYLVAGAAGRAVNAILTQAMIADRSRKGNSGDNKV